MSGGPEEKEESSRRRLLVLLLAAFLALIGAGTGSRDIFASDDDDSAGGPSLSIDYSVTPDDREPTPTPTPTPTADRGVSSVTYPRNPDESGTGGASESSGGSDAESTPTPEPWRDDEPDGPPQSFGAVGGGGGGEVTGTSTATPTPTPTPSSDLVTASIPPVSVADVAPGDGGDVELALTLTGSPARLWIRGEASGFEERGLGEAEQGADDTSDVGELQNHVLVRLWYETAGGDVPIYEGTLASLNDVGRDGGWAPLTEGCVAPGTHTVRLRWDLPADDRNINEIQTDAASFSLGIAADASGC